MSQAAVTIQDNGPVPGMHLPRSSVMVLAILDSVTGMSQKDMVNMTRLSPRAVRYALQKLKEQQLILEKLNLQDLRQSIYMSRALAGACSIPKHWWLARDFVHAKQMMSSGNEPRKVPV
ncbi:MAG: hypothetical protein ABFC24_07310 [Methanoregulaceae archaeon]